MNLTGLETETLETRGKKSRVRWMLWIASKNEGVLKSLGGEGAVSVSVSRDFGTRGTLGGPSFRPWDERFRVSRDFGTLGG